MKKLIMLMLLFCSIAITAPITSCALLPTTALPTVTAVTDSESAVDVEVQNDQVTEIQAPAANFTDILTPPGEGSTTADKIYWIIALIVFVLYEIVFRLIPTTRSLSILTILYNVLNMLLKDRATNGGIFKVKKE